MATYSDFLRQHRDGARLRRLYWICGDEEVFRIATVARIKELAGVEPYNIAHLNAAEVRESEIWATLNQHPIDTEHKRLLVVTEAQRLKHLDRLVGWIKDNQVVRSRSATAVFVSNDPDFPESEERDLITKSSSALLVRCALPKAEDDRLKRATEVVCSWGHIDPTTAGVLIKRVNYDMAEARAVIDKAALFPDARLNVAAVEILAPRKVEEDIVWSLLSLNKRAAIEAAQEAAPNTAGRVIASLVGHVDMLARLNARISGTSNVKELAKKTGAREQYVRTLLPYARLYPRKEAVRRILLLNRLDAAWQRGAREGVLESLIALW